MTNTIEILKSQINTLKNCRNVSNNAEMSHYIFLLFIIHFLYAENRDISAKAEMSPKQVIK